MQTASSIQRTEFEQQCNTTATTPHFTDFNFPDTKVGDKAEQMHLRLNVIKNRKNKKEPSDMHFTQPLNLHNAVFIKQK